MEPAQDSKLVYAGQDVVVVLLTSELWLHQTLAVPWWRGLGLALAKYRYPPDCSVVWGAQGAQDASHRHCHFSITFPAPLRLAPGVGVWPYPSVPDTGYNSIPLKALPFGDYLTPATKEKKI